MADSQTRPRKERRENAQMRRTQLMDATRRSIVAHGLARTTLATVAAEAGLSQGVAVFYFKSKTGLLTEVLRDHYQRYQDNWQAAMAAAGNDPLAQIVALIRADFAPGVCDPGSLALWFAFWGEEKFTPQYTNVCVSFDQRRRSALEAVCTQVLDGVEGLGPDQLADWIDTLTDGYWQKLHLFSDTISPAAATTATLKLLAWLLPLHAHRIRTL